MYKTIGRTLYALLWLCSSRRPLALEMWRRSIFPMRTCLLASFSSDFCSCGYCNRKRSWLALWNSLCRLTGRWRHGRGLTSDREQEDSWMKGCGRLSHPSPLQILENSFCLQYVCDADENSIKCSILVILNVHYNTGNKSMHDSLWSYYRHVQTQLL